MPEREPPSPPSAFFPRPARGQWRRAIAHFGAFWLGGVGAIVLNLVLLMWWLDRDDGPLRDQWMFVLGIVTFASMIFLGVASRLAVTTTHRMNPRFVRSLAAGLGYGVCFVWPLVFIVFASPQPPRTSNEPWWAAVGWLCWSVLALPAALGLALGRALREVRPGSGMCVGCGYDLRGSTDHCPECGEPMRDRGPTPPRPTPETGAAGRA